MAPSRPSTRPSGSGARRSSAFVRERHTPIDSLIPVARGMMTPRPPFGMAGGCRGASGGTARILAPDDSVWVSGRPCLVGLVYQGPGRADFGLLAVADGD